MYYSKKMQVGSRGRKEKFGCKITIADEWFSRFIRLRDATFIQLDGLAFGNCITCNKLDQVKYLQCGHYVTRDRPLTRFDERNSHAQCPHCNEHKKGEQAQHGFKIDHLYGQGTAEYLMQISKIRGSKNHTDIALKDIANEYRLKTNALLKEKRIKKWW